MLDIFFYFIKFKVKMKNKDERSVGGWNLIWLNERGARSRLVCHNSTIRHRLISFSTALLPLGWCQVAVWRGIAVPEMVGAIKVLRDGFVRMEQMKNPLHQTSKVTFFFRFCLRPETESFRCVSYFHFLKIIFIFKRFEFLKHVWFDFFFIFSWNKILKIYDILTSCLFVF